jgi:hypothetical protein
MGVETLDRIDPRIATIDAKVPQIRAGSTVDNKPPGEEQQDEIAKRLRKNSNPRVSAGEPKPETRPIPMPRSIPPQEEPPPDTAFPERPNITKPIPGHPGWNPDWGMAPTSTERVLRSGLDATKGNNPIAPERPRPINPRVEPARPISKPRTRINGEIGEAMSSVDLMPGRAVTIGRTDARAATRPSGRASSAPRRGR